MNISQQRNFISFYCVLKDLSTKEDSPSLLSCAEHIKEHLNVGTNLKWVDEGYCLSVDVKTLRKTDIFIFAEFSGAAFEHITTKSNALVIGPPCLEYCITQDFDVPLGHSPIFNVAMHGLIVCPSGVSKTEKAEMKKLVLWMGGYFTIDLDMDCTHLVTDTVRSKKYEEAATAGIQILHPDWVKDVWRANQEHTVLARDPIFEKHRLPIFHKLVITSTNLPVAEKEEIRKLIEANGGTYSRVYKTNIVNILILKKDATSSEKYKISLKFKIDCLTPEWVYESVRKKYAVPIDSFRVSSMQHSTPTKDDGDIGHFSMMSNISRISSVTTVSNKEIDETVQNVQNNTQRPSTSKMITPNKDETVSYKDRLKSLTLTETKNSGAFLDGCNIYLIGFTRTESMKLNKIISNAGATLYTDLSDSISHVVCGNATEKEIKGVHDSKVQCKIVTFDWLLESQRLQYPAEEENYMMLVKRVPPEAEPPSPASKKSIEAMNASFKRPADVPRRRLDLGESSSSVVQKYLHPIPEVSSLSNFTHDSYNSDVAPEDIEVLTFLQSTTFYFYGYEEGMTQLMADVESALGVVVNDTYTGIVDYILVPVDGVEKIEPPVKGTNIVNDLWLEDCVANRGIVPIMYYHEPIVIQGYNNILHDVRLSFTNFQGSIKLYLAAVAGVLGATILDQYPKKETPLLICAKTEGSKYEAALKWKYPVVTDEWLLDTFKEKRVKKIEKYLLGKSIIPEHIEVFQRLNQEEVEENKSQDNSPINDEVFLGDLTTEGNPTNATLQRSAKRKSDELDNDDDDDDTPIQVRRDTQNKNKPSSVSTPIRHKRLALLTLETPTNKKNDDTPTTSKVNKIYADFDTPVRKTIRDTMKLNININDKISPNGTVKTPEIPKYLKMPNTPLSINPNASPCTQWGVQRSIEAAEMMRFRKGSPKKKSPTAEQIREEYFRTLLGEDKFNEIRLKNATQSQSLQETGQTEMNTEPNMESLKKLKAFVANNRVCPPTTPILAKQLDFNDQSEGGAEHQSRPQCGTSEELVGWVDPSEFHPFRHSATEATPSKVYNFHITGVSENKKQIAEMIENLGGTVLSMDTYDPSCTHVVFERLNRGEKVLGAVASGKWILGIKYLHESTKVGHFLPEEEYEVGNERLPFLSQLSESEKQIARAAYRWRQKIHKGKSIDGAYSGMTCLLILGEQSNAIGRMIEAGKGSVVKLKSPYCGKSEAKSITHVFIKPTKDNTISKMDMNFFKKNGTHVLTLKYITSHLFDEIAPNPENFNP